MRDRRSRSFYALAAFFAAFVLFLYGPLSAIVILSFQGPDGGLTFPMNGVSLHWFAALFEQQRVGDFKGAFRRSFELGLVVMVLTSVNEQLAVRFSQFAGYRGGLHELRPISDNRGYQHDVTVRRPRLIWTTRC